MSRTKIENILREKLKKDKSFHFKCCQNYGECKKIAILAFEIDCEDCTHPEGYHFRCEKHQEVRNRKKVINLTALEIKILKKLREDEQEKRKIWEEGSPIEINIVEVDKYERKKSKMS